MGLLEKLHGSTTLSQLYFETAQPNWFPPGTNGRTNVIIPVDTIRQKVFSNLTMSSISNLSAKQLRKAATLKEKIQSLENELNHLLGSSAPAAAVAASTKKKFKMSAAARAKISAAAKARWAKVRGAKSATKPAATKPARKARGKMSAAAKAKLSAKLKAVWAARKAAKQ
jgi:hypothetical protein